MAIQGELELWGPNPAQVLLTIKQAAHALGISRSTLYELIADGQLEVVHIGRRALVPVAALAALVNQLRGAVRHQPTTERPTDQRPFP